MKVSESGMIICGITGTNGKTTSTYLLESILTEWGKPTAVIGTIENRMGDYRIPTIYTTPPPEILQSTLADFKNRGAKAVVMEVSSHGLDQKRITGTNFDCAIFTNLTQDHLDYHGSIKNYFEAKARLFLDYSPSVRAIHTDDPFGARLAKMCRNREMKVISYGKKDCDLNYGELKFSKDGIQGNLTLKDGGVISIRSSLLGTFNAQNLAGVAAAAVGLGIPNEVIARGLSKAAPVPGRMQAIPNSKGLTVIVDYAHTPDALENVLKTARALCPGKLICVFGCGGDRDTAKRPLMATVAERLADLVFVTSDNPRTENPEKIIDDIFSGFKDSSKPVRLSDRRKAIASAIESLNSNDILLIAGKGHETYQIIGKQKLPFDDREVAREYLK